MRRLLFAITVSSALLLSACSSDEPTNTTEDTGTDNATEEAAEEGLQAGTYTLEELNFGETGWKESLEIVVADGEISDATWTSVNEDGLNKLEDDNYQESMSGVSGVGPQDYTPELEEALVEKQDPAEVEVVTGATGTSTKFKEYAQQLVAAAEEGNTETIEVDNQGE